MSRDGCVALPCGTMGLSAGVFMVFPDHTHLLFYQLPVINCSVARCLITLSFSGHVPLSGHDDVTNVAESTQNSIIASYSLV